MVISLIKALTTWCIMSYSELIPKDLVCEVWPEVAPFIAKVLQYNTGYDLVEIEKALTRGIMDLWVFSKQGNSVDAIVVAYPIKHPLYTEYFMFLGCGKPGHYTFLKEGGSQAVEEYALSKGCEKISTQLRLGVEHLVEGLGYNLEYKLFGKNI